MHQIAQQVENMCIEKLKKPGKYWRLKGVMQVVFNFNGCNKLEKYNFSNIVVMKVSVVFEFNNTNRSSADTNLDNFRFY